MSWIWIWKAEGRFERRTRKQILDDTLDTLLQVLFLEKEPSHEPPMEPDQPEAKEAAARV